MGKEEAFIEKMRLSEKRISERMDRLSYEQEQLENKFLYFLKGELQNDPAGGSQEDGFRRLDATRILVIHDGTSEASLAQYIGRLADFCPDWNFDVRLFPEVTPTDVIQASLIVCVRYLGEIPFASQIQALQIPMYYYTDDFFPELLNPEALPDCIRETIQNTNREFLCRFSGVILSTPALRDAFREKGLHDRLYVHPFIFKEAAVFPHLRPRSAQCIRAAFYGGAHRVPALLEYVLPALARLSSQIPVELYLPPVEGMPADLGDGLKIITLPYMRFEEGLRVYAGFQIDLLLYPSLPQVSNRYKDYNALFSAVSLDAVLIGSRDEPLASIPDYKSYCILVENNEGDWASAFRYFWSNPEEMRQIRQNARHYCEGNSGERTILADYHIWLAQAKEAAGPSPSRDLFLALCQRQMELTRELEQQRQNFVAEMNRQRENFATEFQRAEQRLQYQQAILLELIPMGRQGRLSRVWDWLTGGNRRADLTSSLESTQPAFLDRLRQKNSLLTPSHCLLASLPLPFHTYVEYSIANRGYKEGDTLCFFVFASPQSAIFLETVKDSQIIKQERLVLPGDGEVCWPLEDPGGEMRLRMKTLDNFSIIRVLEMAGPHQRQGTVAYYFRKSGESS